MALQVWRSHSSKLELTVHDKGLFSHLKKNDEVLLANSELSSIFVTIGNSYAYIINETGYKWGITCSYYERPGTLCSHYRQTKLSDAVQQTGEGILWLYSLKIDHVCVRSEMRHISICSYSVIYTRARTFNAPATNRSVFGLKTVWNSIMFILRTFNYHEIDRKFLIFSDLISFLSAQNMICVQETKKKDYSLRWEWCNLLISAALVNFGLALGSLLTLLQNAQFAVSLMNGWVIVHLIILPIMACQSDYWFCPVEKISTTADKSLFFSRGPLH